MYGCLVYSQIEIFISQILQVGQTFTCLHLRMWPKKVNSQEFRQKVDGWQK